MSKAIKLHYQTVTPSLRDVLGRLMLEPIFKPFVLVGGTSLSLRLGHRKSIDIDLFTNAPYGSLDFTLFDNFFQTNYHYCYFIENIGPTAMGHSYYVGVSEDDSIKVDLFYHDGITEPCEITDSIRFASIADITAMKVDIIERGGRKKDFWDLHELKNLYSISEMIEFHRLRNEYTHNRLDIINGFTDFSMADKDIDPICLMGKQWELIKLDFVEWIDPLL